jgi:DNA polymerase III alpha subunit
MGIYMTGHPLGAYARVLESLSTFKIAEPPEIPFMEEVGADRPLRVAVRLGGMLKACTVRMSKPKKEGDVPQPWAILVVDDGEYEMEALAFAKTFAKYREWLPESVDQPVLLCGELAHRTNRDTRAEEPDLQFVVREAYPLATGLKKFSSALHVTMRYTDATLVERATALKALAAAHPGGVKVLLDLVWPNGTTTEVDSGIQGVELTDEFLTELGRLQKGDPYRLKTIKDIFLEPPEPRKWERRN